MIGFEMFDIGSWVQDGLTRQIAPQKWESATVVKRTGKWIVSVALSVAACSLPSFSAFAFDGEIANSVSDVRVLRPSVSAGDVREGYWPVLMASMSTWQASTVEEVDSPFDAFI